GNRTALPRQQTLRALIDWSYDLLNDQEKALLNRLSVFAGGWTLEAAEQVCALSPPAALETQRHSEEEEGQGTREKGKELEGSEAIQTPNSKLQNGEVLDLLLSLVDKSLVVYEEHGGEGTGRYRLLETVRQYARERLAERGEAGRWRRRH